METDNSYTTSFKKFLLRLLLPLIALLLIAGYTFNYFFEKNVIFSTQISGAYKVNRILTEDHPGEIPIFGSSRAQGAFIPDSLGPDYFNYGISGAHYDATLFFLREECKKIKRSPWILLNFDLEGLTSNIGNIAYYIPDAGYGQVRALMGGEYSFRYRIPLVKYYGDYDKYLSEFINARAMLTGINNKGASLEKKVFTGQRFQMQVAQRERTRTRFYEEPKLSTELLEIIAAHPSRNFVFVVSPYHPSFFKSFANPQDANALFDRLRACKNVKILDYGKMALPDSMFYNTSHLNYLGAIAFSAALKDTLRKLGVN